MGGHYFDEDPTTVSRPSTMTMTLDGRSVALRTDRGVFSPRRLDPGTAALLDRRHPSHDEGVLVDVGCGYGPIAISLALRAPSCRIVAVDVNERARSLCRENVAALGLDNVEVLAPDDVPPELVVAEVWSNPPIRIGKPALQTLLLGWLERLAGDGTGELVVARHLGADSLQRWLTSQGFPTERLASRKGYRLLHVSRR